MAFSSKLRAAFHRASIDDVSPVSVEVNEKTEESKGDNAVAATAPDTKEEDENSDLPTTDAQRGVHDVEAVTLTWTKTTLVAVFMKCVCIPLSMHIFPPFPVSLNVSPSPSN